MKYLVTRHQGAKQWVEEQGIVIDELIVHLDATQLQSGDTVIGTLPINIVATLNNNGIRYFHLSLNLPANARGKELTADDMTRFGAKLEEYQAVKCPTQ